MSSGSNSDSDSDGENTISVGNDSVNRGYRKRKRSDNHRLLAKKSR